MLFSKKDTSNYIGGDGGLYCTNHIKPARKEEKRREEKRREEKRREEKRREEKRREEKRREEKRGESMECFAHLRLIPLPFATLQVKVENFRATLRVSRSREWFLLCPPYTLLTFN
jgi:hypothetical protein